MSTHKHIDKICLVAAILAIVLCVLFMHGEAFGIQPASHVMGYESRLFDTSHVHTIDIVMEDWDSFLESCENEEYAVCAVTIDGETYHNVGIRAKGNTSLSTVSSMDSDRYSFKIEFDQYDSTKSYHGLDKLSLNNLIQDSTMMKDYLTYQLMGAFGAAAPLCSYAYITVNGEDWGLYLAVEAVEESFLQRNYGTDYGQLYKPDSMNFGGGRGNGRDFNMEDFMNERGSGDPAALPEAMAGSAAFPEMPGDFDPSAMFDGGQAPFDPAVMFGEKQPGSMGGGMGSEESKLQYIDDDPDSYATIFSSAKTSVTEADQTRLIESLKNLSEGETIESVVDIDQVLRYFVVHNFVVNGDSYTGSMIHNYYLYEEDGVLAMIPWDYNLAFGTFQGRDANSAVNDPIDTPLSVTGSGDRPMVDWIFRSEAYTQLYHQYFTQFLEQTDFAAIIDKTAALIADYVEKDPSKFYTADAFAAGVAAIREFCLLREQSVLGQLAGTIPSTDDGQAEAPTTVIDASHLTLSDMGSMNMGGGRDGNMPGRRPGGQSSQTGEMQGAPSMAMPVPDKMTTPSEGNETVGTRPAADSGSWMPGSGGSNPKLPSERNENQLPEQSSSAVMLLAISGVVLLLGLIIAKKYRH